MKNKLYYGIFVVYGLMVAFILYINGVFTGEADNLVNLLINVGFLVIIGILFVISGISFGRLNRCTDDLSAAADRMYAEYKEKGKNVWEYYQDKKDVFQNESLKTAFAKYRARMRNYRTKRGYVDTCDIEEFINEDLLDSVGLSYYNSGISGTMTGLGILGTFLGLSMGLGSFSGNDIFTISDNIGPLLSGMKVAFHTSVYGIFFSLIFSFVYRSQMADAYEKLERFLEVFRQCAKPPVIREDENSAVMLVYQANMSNSLKQIAELLQGSSLEQAKGVERMVEQFTKQLQASLGADFKKLGDTMRTAGEAQKLYADTGRELLEAQAALAELSKRTMEALEQAEKRQQEFAGELEEQKKILADTCEGISDDVSSQLYTFEKMRSLYEK